MLALFLVQDRIDSISGELIERRWASSEAGMYSGLAATKQ